MAAHKLANFYLLFAVDPGGEDESGDTTLIIYRDDWLRGYLIQRELTPLFSVQRESEDTWRQQKIVVCQREFHRSFAGVIKFSRPSFEDCIEGFQACFCEWTRAQATLAEFSPSLFCRL